MNYAQLVDPPVSEAFLKNFVKLVIEPSNKNNNVTVVTARGMGISSIIRFFLRNYSHFNRLPSNKVYLMLDLQLINDETRFYKEAVFGLLNLLKSTDKMNPSELAVLQEFHENLNLGYTDFAQLIHFLTYERKLSVTLIFENTGLWYTADMQQIRAFDTLIGIAKINPMQVSFIFLTNHEFNAENTSKLHALTSYFTQNFVWGRELAFDQSCAHQLFINNGKWSNYNFSDKVMERAWEISPYDPSTLKHIAQKIIGEPEIGNQLIESKEISEIYKIIGPEFLDVRFDKISSSLFPQTLADLVAEKPNDYLVKLGLTDSNGKNLIPLLKEYLMHLKVTLPKNEETTEQKELIQILTVKELSIFEELSKNYSHIVTRDRLSEILWGENWQEYYSDWALNKQVSNLRKKMTQVKYPKTIKVLKTEGFMLV